MNNLPNWTPDPETKDSVLLALEDAIGRITPHIIDGTAEDWQLHAFSVFVRAYELQREALSK